MRSLLVVLFALGCGRTHDRVRATPDRAEAAPTVERVVPRMALGVGHACALRPDGRWWCWGANERGQLGAGDTRPHSEPTRVELTDVAEVSAGSRFTCARSAAGIVRCWGINAIGQLGDGTTVSRSTPGPVVGVTSAVQLASASAHSCARLADGSVACWGDNRSNQLGGSATPAGVVRVQGVHDAIDISVAGGHSCALSRGGSVRCWGTNGRGQLGYGEVEEQAACGEARGDHGASIDVVTPAFSAEPMLVADLAGAVEIAALDDRTCARFADGSIRCTRDPLRDAPASLTLEGAATQLSGGTHHGCARLVDGTVRCFGSNHHGESGRVDPANPQERSVVAGLADVVEVRCGDGFSCAMRGDGSVSCWGRNGDRELGDGGAADRPTAAPVLFRRAPRQPPPD